MYPTMTETPKTTHQVTSPSRPDSTTTANSQAPTQNSSVSSQSTVVSASHSTLQEPRTTNTTTALRTSQNGLSSASSTELTEYQKQKLELVRQQNQLLERIVRYLEQNGGVGLRTTSSTENQVSQYEKPCVHVEKKKLVVITDEDSGFLGVFQPVIDAIEEGIRKKSLPFDIIKTTLASVNSVSNGFFYLVLIPCGTCRPDGTGKFARLQKSNQLAVFIYQTNNENGIQARARYTSRFRSGVRLDVKEDINAETETEGVSFAVNYATLSRDKRILQPYQHNTDNMDKLLGFLQDSLRA